jgi:hypothetical protein
MEPMIPTPANSDRHSLQTTPAEKWETSVDFGETDAQDSGHLPARACRFHITDPQHWLDLCA